MPPWFFENVAYIHIFAFRLSSPFLPAITTSITPLSMASAILSVVKGDMTRAWNQDIQVLVTSPLKTCLLIYQMRE